MTTLAQYDRARAALAEATRLDEVLPLLDEFELVKLRARQIKDQALLADATEFQLRAERRLGEVLAAAKEAGLFRQGRQPQKEKNPGTDFLERPTLAEAGVDNKLSARAQGRASISEQAFEAMVKATRERITAGKARIIEHEPINGARSIMGSRQEPDDSLDFFPTPPWATRALAQHVLPAAGFAGKRFASVWEPACGEGHIAEVLSEYADKIASSDIFDYGYGDTVDFLNVACEGPPPDWIITNPPFGDKAIAFVLRALDIAREGVAMFFRSQWAVEGIERYEQIFRHHPPTLAAFFVERVNLCKGRWDPDGTTATAYCWLVWIKGRDPLPPYWIPPGCREQLTRPDDAERFICHPVKRINSESQQAAE
jgi:hypothetical protein